MSVFAQKWQRNTFRRKGFSPQIPKFLLFHIFVEVGEPCVAAGVAGHAVSVFAEVHRAEAHAVRRATTLELLRKESPHKLAQPFVNFLVGVNACKTEASQRVNFGRCKTFANHHKQEVVV